MKTKIALLAVAVAFAVTAAAPRAAQAGDVGKGKKLTNEIISHVLMIATILDKNINTPDEAVAKLSAYFTNKKRLKRLALIMKQMKALNLTEADKKVLEKWAKGKKIEKRVKKSVMGFFMKNPSAMQKLLPVLMKLKGLMPK